MTLVELLVAFMIFVIMVVGLMGLASTTLDHWRKSEGRKDTVERAQLLLDTLGRDLRATYSESAWVDRGDGRVDSPAAFWAQPSFLRWVRTSLRDGTPAGLELRSPAGTYSGLTEVAYRYDPSTTTLFRAGQPFRRGGRESWLGRWDAGEPAPDVMEPIDTAVLHFEALFWGPRTRAWTEEGADGPLDFWDSTRRAAPSFPLRLIDRRAPHPCEDPAFAFPTRVRLRFVLESQAADRRPPLLARKVGPGDRTFELSESAALPDGPAFARVGEEWVRYTAKTASALAIDARGAWGTQAREHEPGTAVRVGDEFVTEVALPISAGRGP